MHDAPKKCEHSLQPGARTNEDRPSSPLCEQVNEWIEARDAADRLVTEWQSLEHKLFQIACSQRADLEKILASQLPASQRFRSLTQQIAADDRRLGRAAERIAKTPSLSARDAMAKIQLALRLAQFQCVDENQWALVKSGFDDLRILLDRGP